MADESPAEREERLQRAEERLEKQHNRLMEKPPSGGGGGGIGGFFSQMGEHKVMLIGAIVGIAFVVYVIYKGRTSATTTANQGANQQGSLGNAGYQDSGVAYALTQLGQQLNNLQATMSAPPPTTNPPPAPNPVVGPLIPSGTYSGPSFSNLKPGTTYKYNNVLYTLFTGGGGRLYGTNPSGQSVLLYGPPSAYPAQQPLNSQANHSPIPNFMPLTVMADKGFDVSNLSVAARPGLGISPHPGLAMQIRG